MNLLTQSFILDNTRLRRPSLVPELELYLGDDITSLWSMTQAELGNLDAPPPFWAVAWPGGQAIARYLLDRPHETAGKRVLDLATGSGVCAIAALKGGAAYALAVDTDIVCKDVVALNARVNGVRVTFKSDDMLDSEPPEMDLIVAGDVCYEKALTPRILRWLGKAHERGTRVLIGDPDRNYFPHERFRRLAEYRVPTTLNLESTEVKQTGVFTFPARNITGEISDTDFEYQKTRLLGG